MFIMPSRKVQRQPAADNIIRLVRILHKRTKPTVFELSPHFCNDSHTNVDELDPLEELQWNGKTKRYQIDKTSKNNYSEDDAILYAMVMLFIVARLQHGWSHVETCSKLTIWPVGESSNTKVRPDTDLPREWDDEMLDLIKEKRMSPRHCHSQQNFRSFAYIYTSDYSGSWSFEDRKSKDKNGWAPFYEVAEQSVLQWALEYRKDNENASELALMVLHILLGLSLKDAKDRVAVARKLRDIVLQEAMKDDPETFCKNAITAVERAFQQKVFEEAIDEFRPDSFINEYLPTVRNDQNSKGIFRAWKARNELKTMVLSGEYPT